MKKTCKICEKKKEIKKGFTCATCKKGNDRVFLKKKLDIAFSKMIRERDEGKPCIDGCGKKGTLQAGHFRRRECMATRWHLKNVNGQLEYCNCWDNDLYRHGKGIDQRWGEGTAEHLYKLSGTTKQWTSDELKTMIKATSNIEEYEFIYSNLTLINNH